MTASDLDNLFGGAEPRHAEEPAQGGLGALFGQAPDAAGAAAEPAGTWGGLFSDEPDAQPPAADGADALGGLFDTPAGQPAPGGMGDLFTSTSPSTSPEAEVANGIGGLFEDTASTPVDASNAPPADEPSGSSPETPGSAGSAAAGEQAASADPFANFFVPVAPTAKVPVVFGSSRPDAPEVADAAPREDAALTARADETAAPAAPAAPVNPFAAPVGASNPFGAPDSSAAPVDAAAPVQKPTRVEAQRARRELAREQEPAQVSAATLALAQQDRYVHAEQYQQWVDQLLGLGRGGEPLIAAFVRNLELTRDHAVDQRQRMEYQQIFEPRLAAAGIQIHSAEEMTTIFDIAYDDLLGIGPLGPLWRDDSISEIMVSGPHRVTIERDGRKEITPVQFRDLEHLESVSRNLGQRSADDRSISPTSPLVTIQLPGARVQFVWRPLAVSRVAISIRKFGQLMGMSNLMGRGALSEDMRSFLEASVRARATILISGGTSAGKTTFINALSEYIPDQERVITIEDALELQLRNLHVEAFVTKEAASADDKLRFGQDALLKASLRMNPDRIIVGEIRDPDGAAVMLEAANTGHAGTMTTIHANNPAKAMQRLAQLVARVDGVPRDVALEEARGAIDVVVQVLQRRNKRYVSHISIVDSETSEVVDVFRGEYPMEATGPVFRRVGSLGPDTDLAQLMLNAGLDPSAWEG